MPDFVFKGPLPYDYPATRDSFGVPLGTVSPGDTARLDEPPDMWWVPWEGGGGDQDAGGDADSGTPVVPDGTDQTSEAGETGSEE